MKRYVVQTQWEVEQFNHLDVATGYARLVGFANLYQGDDVVEIQGAAVTHKPGARVKRWTPQGWEG